MRFRQEIQTLPRAIELTEPRPSISVAAGILRDAAGRVLIAQRPAGGHLAGWWEFPGGKIVADESPRQALDRELAEELNITVLSASKLLTFAHEYPERTVTLHAYRVARYSGQPVGAEGQTVQWAYPDELLDLGLLPADLPIVTALQSAD